MYIWRSDHVDILQKKETEPREELYVKGDKIYCEKDGKNMKCMVTGLRYYR